MIKKKDLSQEDAKVWENFTKNTPDIYDTEKNQSVINSNKERFKFDLHGFTLKDANIKVRELIFLCTKNKYKEIINFTNNIRLRNINFSYIKKNTLKFHIIKH